MNDDEYVLLTDAIEVVALGIERRFGRYHVQTFKRDDGSRDYHVQVPIDDGMYERARMDLAEEIVLDAMRLGRVRCLSYDGDESAEPLEFKVDLPLYIEEEVISDGERSWEFILVSKSDLLRAIPLPIDPIADEEPGTEALDIRTDPPAESAQAWLVDLMKKSPEVTGNPKAFYLAQATNKFGISKRAFNRIWDAAISESGAVNWAKAGRKRSKSIHQ
jgi:hypothetical protein